MSTTWETFWLGWEKFQFSVKISTGAPHLPHPLILDLRNLGVGVTHHSDQKVEKQNHNNGDEDEEVYFANDLMISVGDSFPDESNITKRHQEDSEDRLHCTWHWMSVTYCWLSLDLVWNVELFYLRLCQSFGREQSILERIPSQRWRRQIQTWQCPEPASCTPWSPWVQPAWIRDRRTENMVQ